MKTPQARSVDPASLQMLSIVADRNLAVAWDRYDAQQQQCGFGQLGLCCRYCTMGPCRIDPLGLPPDRQQAIRDAMKEVQEEIRETQRTPEGQAPKTRRF